MPHLLLVHLYVAWLVGAVVPGSHKLISEVGAGNPVGPLPPAINAECPAGTVVMFEGRLLHGTGKLMLETLARDKCQ